MSSFQSVSADPPLVSFSIAAKSNIHADILNARYVGISLLGIDQQEIGARYSTEGSQRFKPNEYYLSPLGCPLIQGAVFHLVTEIERAVTVGSSDIYYCKVLWGDNQCTRMPLTYWRRRFISS